MDPDTYEIGCMGSINGHNVLNGVHTLQLTT